LSRSFHPSSSRQLSHSLHIGKPILLWSLVDRILVDQELENASTGRDSGEPGDEMIVKDFLGMGL
jgi:hypothetical protein